MKDKSEITVRQLADYLRISVVRARQHLVRGDYPVKFRKEMIYGGRGIWLIDKESVLKWVDEKEKEFLNQH